MKTLLAKLRKRRETKTLSEIRCYLDLVHSIAKDPVRAESLDADKVAGILKAAKRTEENLERDIGNATALASAKKSKAQVEKAKKSFDSAQEAHKTVETEEVIAERKKLDERLIAADKKSRERGSKWRGLLEAAKIVGELERALLPGEVRDEMRDLESYAKKLSGQVSNLEREVAGKQADARRQLRSLESDLSTSARVAAKGSFGRPSASERDEAAIESAKAALVGAQEESKAAKERLSELRRVWVA